MKIVALGMAPPLPPTPPPALQDFLTKLDNALDLSISFIAKHSVIGIVILAICGLFYVVFALLRKLVRKHLNDVLDKISGKGTLSFSPWQSAVWLHQAQAGVPIFSKSFFLTTWNVHTGWRLYKGHLSYLWLPSPVHAVEVARELRSKGWKDVFICSTRFGLTGPSRRMAGNLDDPVVFSNLALGLEREQNEKITVSLIANAFSNVVHYLFGAPVGIVRALTQVVRFGRSRQHPSWHDFCAILIWRFSGKPAEEDRLVRDARSHELTEYRDQKTGWPEGPNYNHVADYTYEVHDNVIAIIENPDMRITNNAECVIADFAANGLDLSEYQVIYRDSEGVWNQMLVKDGRFAGFRTIYERKLSAALAKLQFATT